MHKENMAGIEQIRKGNGITHSLSNSTILMQKQALAILTRRLATVTGSTADERTALHAEHEYEEYRRDLEKLQSWEKKDKP